MKQSTHLEATLSRIDQFLADYYEVSKDDLDVQAFVLEPDEVLAIGGQLLVSDLGHQLEVGIRFGTELIRRFSNPCNVGLHEIGVVSEEVSHLRTLLHAAESGARISILDLEVLGEVDRFLTGLHAPELFSNLAGSSIEHLSERSLEDLCNRQFEQRYFDCSPDLTALYIQAEALALKHLNLAFSHCWGNTRFDGQRCDQKARSYLVELRRGVVTEGRSVRLFPESA